jgi:hypothetical protein
LGAWGKSALELSSEIDISDLELTGNALGDDEPLGKFYESMPSFYKSDVVEDLRRSNVRSEMSNTMVRFLHRLGTLRLTSNSISGSVKNRRLAINMKCRQ